MELLRKTINHAANGAPFYAHQPNREIVPIKYHDNLKLMVRSRYRSEAEVIVETLFWLAYLSVNIHTSKNLNTVVVHGIFYLENIFAVDVVKTLER